MKMWIDAFRFLSRIPAEVPMPAAEPGTEEITFEWRHEDLVATASVEGNGRFVLGKGPESLSIEALPNDLLDYLNGFSTD